jgi:hypothetical protein
MPLMAFCRQSSKIFLKKDKAHPFCPKPAGIGENPEFLGFAPGSRHAIKYN